MQRWNSNVRKRPVTLRNATAEESISPHFRLVIRISWGHFGFLQPKKFLLYRFFDYLCTANRGVEQLAARWAHNPKVGGSSPPPATKKESNVFGESTLLFCFML